MGDGELLHSEPHHTRHHSEDRRLEDPQCLDQEESYILIEKKLVHRMQAVHIREEEKLVHGMQAAHIREEEKLVHRMQAAHIKEEEKLVHGMQAAHIKEGSRGLSMEL